MQYEMNQTPEDFYFEVKIELKVFSQFFVSV